jgi:hypothetical protein
MLVSCTWFIAVCQPYSGRRRRQVNLNGMPRNSSLEPKATAMKKLFLTITAASLVSAGACSLAQSTDSAAAREAATERYMRAVPMSRMIEDAYSEMSKGLPPAQRASFVADMRRIVKVETIERLAKASMVKHFTADELNALADFYLSKHGASAMSKFGNYMADVTPPLTQEIQRAVQELQSTGRK